MNPSIFKAYDIRGVYPSDLDEDAVKDVARGYVALIKRENPGIEQSGKKLKIALGMDMRLSSPNLKEAVAEALIESGVDVDDLGLVSTPTFYFGVAYYGYDGGLQVSASHNPSEYNGIKMVRAKGVPMSKDTGIYEIRDMILKGDLPSPATVPGVRGVREGVVEEEAKITFKGFEGRLKPFKIVIDAANAMGALDVSALFRHLESEIIEMNFNLDGTFPAHEADPMKAENLRELCSRVVSEKADFGLAPDGDGDRLFIIDEKGEVVPAHILRGVMAQIELQENPGATVAYDIRPGKITEDMINEFHGKALITPVGHSLIKELMIKEDAIFGGESSGHYYYKMPYGTFEAPMLLTLRFMRWLAVQDKPLSLAIAPFKKYFHSGEINFRLEDKEAIERKIEEIKDKHIDGKQMFVDGISVEYPDYWFNVRASNTEPLLRLTVEARESSTLSVELSKLTNLIES